MATLPTSGDIAAFQRILGSLSNRGPLTSSTVRLPSLSQINFPDSTLGGTVGNPVVITGDGAAAQSPLGSFTDTADNIFGYTQDSFNQSLNNQTRLAEVSAANLYPIQRQNAELAFEFLKKGQETDANRQKQINSAIEKAALAKQGMAAAANAANVYGGLQLTSNIV